MIEQNELLEYAIVYGDYKGIPKQQVRQALASGQDVILRIDVQGAETIRKLVPEALLIFVTVESEEELVRRLKRRKTESPEELALRIATARKELQRVEAFDYVVVNEEDRLDEAVDTIAAIIVAEHHRVHHRRISL
jgi:guanylate kinase